MPAWMLKSQKEQVPASHVGQGLVEGLGTRALEDYGSTRAIEWTPRTERGWCHLHEWTCLPEGAIDVGGLLCELPVYVPK